MSDSKVEVERVHYERGQTLASADLRAQINGAAQLRWWHNRALHEPFGVAWGLAVSEIEDPPGQRSAVVTQGVAHDAFGRELILRNRRNAPFPTNARDQTLLLRYPQGEDHGRSACRGVGELVWQATRDWEVRDGVPLAYTNANGDLQIDPWEQARARPWARPRRAYGITLPGATTWTPWTPDGLAGAVPGPGYQTVIDTTSAGFSETPCYFAWLEGPRMNAARTRVLASLEHLERETPQGFVFCVWLPSLLPPVVMIGPEGGSAGAGSAFVTFARREGLCVRWLAIEPARSPS